jgi:DNA gyrase subunit A
MRVVVELKKGEIPQVVLNQLYKQTPMQSSFGIIMLALVENQPRVLDLKSMLEQFVLHRKEIVIRRTNFDLKKAEARAHILEGLVKALDNLDAVIKLIRDSKDPVTAREGLMAKWKFSEIQAKAILDMQLQRLTGLERDKIIEEHKEILALIEELKSILASEAKVMKIIVKELQDIKKAYGDARRTEIIDAQDEISMEDLIKNEDFVITVSSEGYVKRTAVDLYRAQRRGGKGQIGAITKEEDFVVDMFVASTHAHVLFFTDRGKVFALRIWDLPEADRRSKGKPIINVLPLEQGEKVTTQLPVKEFDESHFLFFVTRLGTVKRVDLAKFSAVRSSGIRAITLDDGDLLRRVLLTDGKNEIVLGSSIGKVIRFDEAQVRAMGRDAAGVKGMDLIEGETIIDADVLNKDATVLTVSELGMGKRTDPDEYRDQKRGGKGILTLKQTEKTGKVMGIKLVENGDQVIATTDGGQMIRIPVKDIRVIGRNTQGVRLFRIAEGEKVVGVAKIVERDDEQADLPLGEE